MCFCNYDDNAYHKIVVLIIRLALKSVITSTATIDKQHRVMIPRKVFRSMHLVRNELHAIFNLGANVSEQLLFSNLICKHFSGTYYRALEHSVRGRDREREGQMYKVKRLVKKLGLDTFLLSAQKIWM